MLFSTLAFCFVSVTCAEAIWLRRNRQTAEPDLDVVQPAAAVGAAAPPATSFAELQELDRRIVPFVEQLITEHGGNLNAVIESCNVLVHNPEALAAAFPLSADVRAHAPGKLALLISVLRRQRGRRLSILRQLFDGSKFAIIASGDALRLVGGTLQGLQGLSRRRLKAVWRAFCRECRQRPAAICTGLVVGAVLLCGYGGLSWKVLVWRLHIPELAARVAEAKGAVEGSRAIVDDAVARHAAAGWGPALKEAVSWKGVAAATLMLSDVSQGVASLAAIGLYVADVMRRQRKAFAALLAARVAATSAESQLQTAGAMFAAALQLRSRAWMVGLGAASLVWVCSFVAECGEAHHERLLQSIAAVLQEDTRAHAPLLAVQRLQTMGRDRQAVLSWPTKLVLGGGGAKEVAILYAVQALEERAVEMGVSWTVHDDVKAVAGTSAGAIGALLLAVGYTTAQIQVLLSEQPLDRFFDDAHAAELLAAARECPATAALALIARRRRRQLAVRLHQSKALFPGVAIVEWLQNLVAAKLTSYGVARDAAERPTFADLLEWQSQGLNVKALEVVACDPAQDHAAIRFNAVSFPDVLIVDAVRASMAIPLVFAPWRPQRKLVGGKLSPMSNALIDGGFVRNFPMEAEEGSTSVLGFRIEADPVRFEQSLLQAVPPPVPAIHAPTQQLDGAWYGLAMTVFGILQGVVQLQDVLDAPQQDVQQTNWHRTIIVSPGPVGTLDFRLSPQDHEILQALGRSAVDAFLRRARFQ